MKMNENTETGNKTGNARLIFGAALIFIGIMFLFDSMNLFRFDVSEIIFSWPSFFIFAGLILIVKSNKKLVGSIFVILGVFFLIPKVFYFINYDDEVIVPVIIIAIGVYILLHKRGETTGNSQTYKGFFTRTTTTNLNRVDDVAIFGGGNKVILSDHFEGGSVTSLFGGSEIDLSQCKLAEGNNFIDLIAVFGGSTFIVPQDWNVTLDVLPLFGGFSNKIVRHPSVVIDSSRRLIIKGIVLFGGGEIKARY